MEANEIICPQCGLGNNELAESCVQCGIIFIKNPGMSTQTIEDDRKRKAIEEAETLLNDIPAPPEVGAFENEIIKKPDPPEDTLEMQIPTEEKTDMKPEAELPQEPKPEPKKNLDHKEIEMEANEAAMETVDGAKDPEALFLSEVNSDKPLEAAPMETAQNTADTPSAVERADAHSGETQNSKGNKEDSQSRKAETLPVNSSPWGNPPDKPQKEENREEKKSEEAKAETGKVTETETPVSEVVEQDHSMSAHADGPEEQNVQSKEKPESSVAEAAPVKAEAPPDTDATIEMPIELVEEYNKADQQAETAKQDTLKKQQEAQAKVESQEKEKAAQAVAMKKKKLALAQAEALKKQKAAQAKAEALKKKKEALAKAQASKKQEAAQARADALKKQKEAQAQAEASSEDVQCACTGMSPAAAAGMNHYERLLGLLKRYKGKAIGINYDNSSEIREAELVDANEEFFSVRVKDKKLQYSYPLKTILTIVEGQEGVEAGEGDEKAKFDAVIKVYPLVLS